MRFVLVGLPPSTNNLYAIVGGRQVKTAVGREYSAAVADVARRAWEAEPSGGAFAVLVTFHLAGRDRDVDGSHKAILDGCSEVIWSDDRQLVLFAARKRRLPHGVLPYVSVVIRPVAALPAWTDPIAAPAAAEIVASPLPPTTNNSYSIWRGIRRKTAAARAASTALEPAINDSAPDQPWRGPVRLRIRYALTANRRDVDGSHKLLLDAARGAWWGDDLQITSFSVAKTRGSDERVVMHAFELSPAA